MRDMRAIGRQNDHENPHCCTNLKHLIDGVSVTSIAYHNGRILGRQIRDTWHEVIFQPGCECESVKRSLLRSSHPLGSLTITRRRIVDGSRNF